MKRKQKAPKNGVELMAQVFMSICETAPRRRIMLDYNDLIVELESGSHEGHAARLCSKDNEIWIELH